jgi:hypothetical protein
MIFRKFFRFYKDKNNELSVKRPRNQNFEDYVYPCIEKLLPLIFGENFYD